MPCNSDYMKQSGAELESKRVCKFIIYLHTGEMIHIPEWVLKAADDYYGNVARLDEATKILCEACRGLSTEGQNKYLYDGRSKDARALADWYERHQAWDVRRVAEEEAARAKILTRERALKKLSLEELKAVGLID